MTRLPITLRLTLAFALAMASVLTAAGLFLYLRLAGDLGRALDASLRTRGEDVSALVLRQGRLGGKNGTFVERGEIFAELLTTDGAVLDSTPSLGGRRLLTKLELGRASAGPTFVDRSSVPGLDEPARMFAVPVARNNARLVVVVGATRENRAEALRSLRRAFLIGGPIALLLTSLAGYLLARGSLRPIESMRRRAASISASSLDERLPVTGASDEIARLGATLNEMLDRLERGVARERRFAADASHELRTPLTLLRTELELALRKERSQEELEAVVRSAAEDVERLTRIADDLLLLARSESGRLTIRREPADLADLLQASANRFARGAGAGRPSVVVASGEPLVVPADRLRIEQAIGNLIDNALRHGGSDVTLRTDRMDGRVEVHVLDDGPGFPPAFLHRAFERFSRADDARSGAGSGLGLAIVAAIARAHDGAVHASNRPAGGADVWLDLPLDAKAAGTTSTDGSSP